jgi:hypothetical protein
MVPARVRLNTLKKVLLNGNGKYVAGDFNGGKRFRVPGKR